MIGLINIDGVANIALEDSMYKVAAIHIFRRSAMSTRNMMTMNTVQSRADHLKKFMFLVSESAALFGSSSASNWSRYLSVRVGMCARQHK